MRIRFVVPLVAWAMTLPSASLPASAQPQVGGEAPGFNLTSLDGATVGLGDFAGQHVVLHFGAGW